MICSSRIVEGQIDMSDFENQNSEQLTDLEVKEPNCCTIWFASVHTSFCKLLLCDCSNYRFDKDPFSH